MPKRNNRAVARAASSSFSVSAWRQVVPLGVMVIAFWILQDRLSDLDFAQINRTLIQVEPAQWAGAAIATAVSFWAVGQYDAMMHQILQTGVGKRTARISGSVAIAIAQFSGFGVVSGALVRWRLLPDMSFKDAGRVSLTVSLCFLAGWAGFASIIIVAFGPDVWSAQMLARCGIALIAVLLVLSLLQPHRLPAIPPVRTILAVVAWVMVDTVFAAMVLWLLLPSQISLSLSHFLPVFLLALGAGMIGATPGGAGPFEIALLSFLPTTPVELLLASVLAYRLIYYVLPAMIGAGVVLRGLKPGETAPRDLSPPPNTPYLSGAQNAAIWSARRAEANLVRQGDFGFLNDRGRPVALAARIGQSLVMFRDPLAQSRAPEPVLEKLHNAARGRQLSAMIYKCGPRTACTARAAGWQVIRIAKEAWVDPADFTPQGPDRRQLRRLLRKAQAAGLVVRAPDRHPPLADMQALSRDWVARRGRERSFSMGRYQADYVRTQRVLLAHLGERLVGFITLNEVAGEWGLDLMRHAADAPQGTMHLLLATAIEQAAASGCPRLSLAAVSHLPAPTRGIPASVIGVLNRAIGQDGLERFKTSFAPNWEPLFAAGPTRFSLIAGLFDTLRCVNRRPAPQDPMR